MMELLQHTDVLLGMHGAGAVRWEGGAGWSFVGLASVALGLQVPLAGNADVLGTAQGAVAGWAALSVAAYRLAGVPGPVFVQEWSVHAVSTLLCSARHTRLRPTSHHKDTHVHTHSSPHPMPTTGWTNGLFIKTGAAAVQMFPYGWRLPGGDAIRGFNYRWVGSHACMHALVVLVGLLGDGVGGGWVAERCWGSGS